MANDEKIDYAVPGCTDVSYSSCLSLNTSGTLPGLDSPAAHATLHNKKMFRDFLWQNNLSAPRVFDKSSAIQSLPIIVKPVDSFSGKGITHLEKPSEHALTIAYNKACAQSATGEVVIEEFVDGKLYSHSAFLSNGKVIDEHFVEETCSVCPFVVDISHLDYSLTSDIRTNIQREVESIAKELKLTDGLIHTQFISDGEKFWFVEITRRCPGDLYSQLIELSGATSYIKNFVAGFLGRSPQPSPKNHSPFILRQTVKAKTNLNHFWLEFSHPAPIKALIPLALPGQAMQAKETRQAIVFYECESQEHLLEVKDKLIQENTTLA
ncbi:ATP-grasp domain-containing protein [Gilvimarinus sp. SDUM040013]|uniref:ATP-grasp domain-containing protein n=1 Tax=Gilvimarinus gilvus TaxID=3058038 RepID=A0ABU4RVX3_9GAMM|nr:ATP-grasp domain-containing protein [Gilvimarinus sp. SDUM040013]MDO3387316.1 ATP-grasp domain-containing protein [Gilvimarinus sp. SDUM040013]MDX6849005.1 ATP-grasp domain-containing protein [Gilvimarinus sp. SDUM040013]